MWRSRLVLAVNSRQCTHKMALSIALLWVRDTGMGEEDSLNMRATVGFLWFHVEWPRGHMLGETNFLLGKSDGREDGSVVVGKGTKKTRPIIKA